MHESPNLCGKGDGVNGILRDGAAFLFSGCDFEVPVVFVVAAELFAIVFDLACKVLPVG